MKDPIASICFVCEWNEGRSAHLELSVRRKLRELGCETEVCSAGLSQGGWINRLRREFLSEPGISSDETEAHRSRVFGAEHESSELVLVSELQMKSRLLQRHPNLTGRVMTVRGFLQGFTPENEEIPADEAHIEDAGGHGQEEKLALYRELEEIAADVARKIVE